MTSIFKVPHGVNIPELRLNSSTPTASNSANVLKTCLRPTKLAAVEACSASSQSTSAPLEIPRNHEVRGRESGVVRSSWGQKVVHAALPSPCSSAIGLSSPSSSAILLDSVAKVERDDTGSTFLTWKTDASVQADESSKIAMLDAKYELIDMMSIQLEPLSNCVQRIETDVQRLEANLEASLHKMQASIDALPLADTASDTSPDAPLGGTTDTDVWFENRFASEKPDCVSKLLSMPTMHYDSQGSLFDRLDMLRQKTPSDGHVTDTPERRKELDDGARREPTSKNVFFSEDPSSRNRLSEGERSRPSSERRGRISIRSGLSGKSAPYASYPMNIFQAEEGVSQMSKGAKKEKSGMQKLAEDVLVDASTAEIVRAMLVKHEMHSMQHASVHHRPNRWTIFVDSCLHRLLTLALWWDRMREPMEGCLPDFLASSYFEAVSMFAVLANSWFVAFGADWSMKNPGKELPQFIGTLEYGFMGWYILELFLKLVAYRLHFFFNVDMKWNWLDFILVVISSLDLFLFEHVRTAGNGGNVVFMRILRILKLAKIFRAFRAMRFVQELVAILDSLTQSMVALFWVFVMLMFMLCVFALVILQGMAEYVTDQAGNIPAEKEEAIREHFGSMSRSMLTLYMAVTGGDDWGPYYLLVEEAGWLYSTIFLFYTFFFTFALFNMLTGIFVEKAVAVSKPDRAELTLQERRRARQDASEFKHLCTLLDQNEQGMITWTDFQTYMQDETMVAYMASIGLEIHDVEMFFKMVAGTSKAVAIEHFVDACMLLKGSASSIDMQQQLYQLHAMARHMFKFEQKCMKQLSHIEKEVEKFDKVTGV